jgi:hypothetical protein
MACIKRYYAENGQESKLYNDLTQTLGELKAEEIYLTLQLPEFSALSKEGVIDDNGEFLASSAIEFFNSFKATNGKIKAQKLTPEEISRNLQDGASKIESPNEDYYIVGGKNVPRVSAIVNEFVKYTGKDSNVTEYLHSGTRYHKIVEHIINGISDKDIDALMENGIQNYERGYLNSARVFIDSLRAKGGVILSELRVASLDANNKKGMAGTIDILHIKPDGTAVLYDLKTGNESPYKREQKKKEKNVKIWDPSDFNYYKARRYSVQTLLYAEMLRNGDSTLGRNPIDVTEIVVVPIEINRNDSNEITDVKLLNGENIRTDSSWKTASGSSFYKESKAYANKVVSGKNTKGVVEARDFSSDITTFLKTILDLNEDFTVNLDKQARNFVEKTYGQKKFTLGQTGNIKHDWVSDNIEERVVQVRALMGERLSNFESDSVSSAIAIFKDSRDPKADLSKYKYQGPRLQRLKKIFSSSRVVNVSRLADIPGYEKYSDVLLLEKHDGTYDLMTTGNIYPKRKFAVKYDSRKSIAEAADEIGIRQFNNTIVGNYLHPQIAKKAGFTLENTYGDHGALRLAMIAMDIVRTNPDMKFTKAIYEYAYSPNTTAPMPWKIDEIVSQVKKMKDIPEIMQVAGEDVKAILESDVVFSKTNYADDPLTDLVDYLSEQLDNHEINKLSNKVEAFRRAEMTNDELAEELLNGINGIRKIVRTKYEDKTPEEQRNAISADPLITSMARAWATLKGVSLSPEYDVSDEFFGSISKWIKSPTATGRKTLDKFFDVFRQHVDRIKHRTQEFLKYKEPYVNALYRENPLYKRGFGVGSGNYGGLDTVTGMGRVIFEDLIVKKTDAKGNIYYTPYLIGEGSPEWGGLNKAQQDFIRMFNDKVEEMFPGKWMRGQIPIVMSTSSVLMHKSKSALTKGDFREAMESTKQAFETLWQTASDKGNFRTEREESKEYSDIPFDAFNSQVVNDHGGFSTETLARIGLDSDMNLVDPKKNRDLNTDLESVLTLFTAHYIKNQEMSRALPIYNLFRSIFKYYEFAYGNELKNTIEMMDEFVDDIAFNIKQGEDKFITKVINLGVQSTSVGLIGLSAKTIVGNASQMTVSSFSDSLINTFSGDKRFPGISAWSKASAIISKAKLTPGESAKITLLRQKYLTDDMSMLSGQKNQIAARGMFTSQAAFAIDRMMELGFREHYILAQMIHDGTYDAHSVKLEVGPDGFTRSVLVYDKELDPRFKGEEGKKLYEAIKKSMRETNELDEKGEITGAYDWHLRERLKAYIARGIGTFDRDLASPWARHSFASALSQFRTWFRDKFQRSTKLEYDAEIFGDWVKDENDEVVWAKEPMKGMLWTLADFATMPKDMINMMRKGELSREDMRNIFYATTSLSSFALLSLLSAALFADEDDEEFNALRISVTSAISEATNAFVLTPFTNMVISPIVFTSYYQRLFKQTGRALMYGTEGDWESTWNTFIEAVPFIKQLPNEYTHVED